MVKADVRRDYYADLGLTPSAETEDIKKQFRKLALKYHPDRNPGKELEFNSKFQAIQAANEILSDPQQRLRYDTDRLRAGYGKVYGPPRANTARKAPPNPYGSYSPKPQPKPTFSTRPQSFHHGPSTGAQRYASYARAAPKQPWEKMQDDGQTRADAYRGFQDMKGNTMPGGWSSFDPRTGHSGAGPRTHSTPNGQTPRPKSAYEYFKKSPKPTSPEPTRAQSTRRKQGFAPRDAGGDEPMAANTSAYTNVPRADRSQTPNSFYTPAPSPTARKSAAPSRAEYSSTPDFERASSRYATAGGERTFFSSAGLGRSASMRDSTSSPQPRPRTNPPSPTPPESGRHRSASPKLKRDNNRNYSSTSSSDTDDDDLSARKPKAVPKSRLRAHRKFNDFHTEHNRNTGNGPDSENSGSTKNVFDTSAFFGEGSPLKASGSPKAEANTPNRNFKSSSHEQLRQPFAARSWEHTDFFGTTQSDKESQDKRARGRSADGDIFDRTERPAGAANLNPARSESESSQKPTPFAQAKFSADAWIEELQKANISWNIPTNDTSKQKQTAASQRQKSPRKQTKPAAKPRSIPQQASVSTEAEEAQTTLNGGNGQESAKTGGVDAEAMDVDAVPPAKATGQSVEPEKAGTEQKEMLPPKLKPSSRRREKRQTSKSFDLKNLGSTIPFVQNNNGGIDDLQDIHATLPFESRPKASRTTIRDVRPRQLALPNPPKRPNPPERVPISAGSKQLGIPRVAWERYVAAMNTYMREWNAFSRRILRHVNARQETIETGMAPNWVNAVGDSTRLKIDSLDQDEGDDKGLNGDENDDSLAAGSGKAGFSAYLRAFDEDTVVMKHWEVARELHRECIVKLGDTRQWILDGGKLI
ncbi:DnaJ domain protein [Aspergillus sclerotioniger CBS 115572]|uniref:DnaJ domain protein n=1 Tax=Aspergillus sclerotioniger CBS 115572 TaxID=1450535 RepID=A0A317WRY7_9EURO|nr:DnaJ domain protein [Aspergillus sclerotioniger CBS 115572]PWY88775.1 DnaJ domain protein [Aspergillus sclerotioniger CBS 115572]